MTTDNFEDLRSPQRQLIEWQIEHADLDALIDQAVLATQPLDELLLRRINRKLKSQSP